MVRLNKKNNSITDKIFSPTMGKGFVFTKPFPFAEKNSRPLSAVPVIYQRLFMPSESEFLFLISSIS